MKKTLIALLALGSLAMGETTTVTTDVTPTEATYDGYKDKGSAEGWENLSWDKFSANNLTTDLKLLGISAEGNYGFNHAGGAENTTYGYGVGFENGVLTMIGRNLVGQETLFASVTNVSSILGGATVADLTGLSVTTTVVNGTGSDSWWGLYKMDSTGAITVFSDLCNDGTGSHNDLRNKTTETITLTDEQVNGLTDTDKLVVLFRQGVGGKTLGITGLEYSAVVNVPVTPPTPGDNVPEPTTATLSLLALAGLAARRRRK